MHRVNTSTKNMSRYAGKWVAIDPQNDRIIAVGETLKDISPLVSGKASSKDKIAAASFKVPRKDEGPYILRLHPQTRDRNCWQEVYLPRGFFPRISGLL